MRGKWGTGIDHAGNGTDTTIRPTIIDCLFCYELRRFIKNLTGSLKTVSTNTVCITYLTLRFYELKRFIIATP